MHTSCDDTGENAVFESVRRVFASLPRESYDTEDDMIEAALFRMVEEGKLAFGWLEDRGDFGFWPIEQEAADPEPRPADTPHKHRKTKGGWYWQALKTSVAVAAVPVAVLLAFGTAGDSLEKTAPAGGLSEVPTPPPEPEATPSGPAPDGNDVNRAPQRTQPQVHRPTQRSDQRPVKKQPGRHRRPPEGHFPKREGIEEAFKEGTGRHRKPYYRTPMPMPTPTFKIPLSPLVPGSLGSLQDLTDVIADR